MDKIILKNMAFYGYHGNLDSEKSQGQRFYVDVEIKTDLTKPGQTDVLEDSINYVEVYNMVASIIGLSVAVRKPSVPIAGVLDYVEVVTTRGQI